MSDRIAPTSGPGAPPMRRWRLSRPGRPVTGPGAWLGLAPWAILAISIVFLLAAALWPLPLPPAPESVQLPSIPRATALRTPIAERERTLASLTVRNVFASKGEFWLAAPKPDELTPEGAVAGTDPGAPPSAPVPVLTKADPIPQDIKPAFENLKLVGVRFDRAGEPVAMIARVSDLTTMFQRSTGEEFVDDAHPQAPWRVIEIDAVYDRVILERAGKRVSLALYTNEPVPVVVVPPPVVVHPPPGAPGAQRVVVRATEADIIRDLRAAGIDEKEIAALTELLRKDPEAFARAQAETSAVPGSDKATGIGEVFKLMQDAAAQKNNPPAHQPTTPPAPPPG